MAWHGLERLGLARLGKAWFICLMGGCMNNQITSFMLQGRARSGSVWCGAAWPGDARRGMAWFYNIHKRLII